MAMQPVSFVTATIGVGKEYSRKAYKPHMRTEVVCIRPRSQLSANCWCACIFLLVDVRSGHSYIKAMAL